MGLVSVSREPEVREPANEVKFLIDSATAAAVGDWARRNVGPDPYAPDESGCYHTTSLYFDTENLDVLNQRGSYARSKYRVRRYGAGDGAFLERKMKKSGVVTKRRSVIGIHDLGRLADPDAQSGWTGYWFHRRILARRLRPVCQVSYRRLARVTETRLGPLRLTLDQDLLAHRTEFMRFDHNATGTLLSQKHMILELKFRHEMPELFSRMMGEFGLTPAIVSKYRLAASALGISEEVAQAC